MDGSFIAILSRCLFSINEVAGEIESSIMQYFNTIHGQRYCLSTLCSIGFVVGSDLMPPCGHINNIIASAHTISRLGLGRVNYYKPRAKSVCMPHHIVLLP